MKPKKTSKILINENIEKPKTSFKKTNRKNEILLLILDPKVFLEEI